MGGLLRGWRTLNSRAGVGKRHVPHRPGRVAARPQLPHADRAVALGQPAAGRVGQQRVVRVDRLAASPSAPAAAGARTWRPQVLAAGHQRHALHRVVVRDGEVVAGRRVPAAQHDVPERQRVAAHRRAALVGEAAAARWRPARGRRPAARHAAAPAAMRLARSARRQAAAGARIERPSGPCGAAAARAMSARLQKHGYSRSRARRLSSDGLVVGQVGGLHPHRAVPAQAEPGQVLQERRRVVRPAACGVDVLDPQQAAVPRRAAPAARDQCCVDVPQMQQPGRAGGEAGGDGC